MKKYEKPKMQFIKYAIFQDVITESMGGLGGGGLINGGTNGEGENDGDAGDILG